MLSKSDLLLLMSKLPYGETPFIVKFADKSIGIGEVQHCMNDEISGYFELSTELGYVYCLDYDNNLKNKKDHRFDIIEVRCIDNYYDIFSDINILVNLNNKIVIMTKTRSEANFISNLLKESKLCFVKVDSETDSEDREKLVNQFKTDDRCNILIGTFQVLSTGWNLSNTDWIIVIDKDCDLIEPQIQQIIARGHRPGRKSVLYFRRYCNGTHYDEIILPFKE